MIGIGEPSREDKLIMAAQALAREFCVECKCQHQQHNNRGLSIHLTRGSSSRRCFISHEWMHLEYSIADSERHMRLLFAQFNRETEWLCKCKCGERGRPRVDNGLPCGIHCDKCFEDMVSECRRRSW